MLAIKADRQVHAIHLQTAKKFYHGSFNYKEKYITAICIKVGLLHECRLIYISSGDCFVIFSSERCKLL